MADNTRVAIAKLSNANYQVWKYKLEMLLIKEDLWEVVSGPPPAEPDDAWRCRDGKARATIGLLVEDNQLVHVRKESNAKGAWEALRRYHQKSTLTSKVFLLKRLCQMRLSETGNMETHVNTMLDLVDQLVSFGETLADHLVVALMLCSLPDSYDTLITALESRPEEDLTLDLVKSKLIHEFKRRQETQQIGTRIIESAEGSEPSTALKLRYGNKQEKQKGKCFFCNKQGHYKKDCRKFNSQKTSAPTRNTANRITDSGEHGTAENDGKSEDNYYACFKVAGGQSLDHWYVDSGATCHMTNQLSFFSSIDDGVQEKVFMADGSFLNVRGKGNGVIKCIDGNNAVHDVLVRDVLYVPALDGSLLSVQKLTSLGLCVNFDQQGCRISKDDVIVATAGTEGHLYKLSQPEAALSARHGEERQCIHLWHRRLGHRNPEGIKLLASKGLGSGIEISNCGTMQTCESCIKGKMTRTSFPKKSTKKSKAVLDLIHTDLCGPMQTATPGGKRYVLTFIDDHSRFTTVYLLAKKNEVYGKLREYVRMTRTKFERTPKVFRSDRGGEYIGEDVKRFLKEEGIQWQLTAPYSPQSNGVAERKNRTLTEMTRCMLIDSSLHYRFWGEGIVTANYLQNLLPSRVLEETPHAIWHGSRPDFRHLRVFGCAAYVLIPKERRRKLDTKARKLVFVGYEGKAYRLLDTTTNQITVSRDVKFIEENGHAISVSEKPKHELGGETSSSDCYIKLDDVESETSSEEVDGMAGGTKIRRSTRMNKGKPPERYIEVMNVTNSPIEQNEPRNITEALSGENRNHWRSAMDEEMTSLRENETWELMDLPSNKRAVGCKWVFKIKHDAKATTSRYKARLVAQGFSQTYGTDYDEVFAPVGKQTTLRALLAVAGSKRMSVRHFDIKTAFLYGKLTDEVYMKQPPGFIVPGKEDLVCKLKRSLYGLKQSARVWNGRINEVLIEDGFQRGNADPCLYSKFLDGVWIYVLVYVDDLIVASVDESLIDNLYLTLSKEFQLKDLGKLQMYLGIQVERDVNGIFNIHQSAYIKRVLERFGLNDAKPSKTPMDTGYFKQTASEEQVPMQDKDLYRQAIGCLLYVAMNSRPDIAVTVSILSRKISDPTVRDWTAVKRIMRYLKGTTTTMLKLGDQIRSQGHGLVGYADADWAGDSTDRKSNSGYIFYWYGGPISWASRKQTSVALSSTEAEFIALAEACQEALWIRKLIDDLHKNDNGTLIYEDNQSCLKMIENEKGSQRTKHIDTKYHFVRDLNSNGTVNFKYCPTEFMIADLLTKPLEVQKTRQLAHLAGLSL